MKIFIAAAAIFVAATPLGAQTGARQALQALERHAGEEVIGKMVAIVGFNGASQPESWQILTLAPKNDAVLHEFIVRGKTVTGAAATRVKPKTENGMLIFVAEAGTAGVAATRSNSVWV